MKIVGIIPARGGSKGVPRKNIKLLAGKPLIAYTIEAAINSKHIDKVVVSTEDKEIAEISRQYGAEIIERPIELAQDDTKTAPVIIHAVQELKKKNYNPAIIVLLQATAPFRDEQIIDSALEQLINSDKDSIFTGYKGGPCHGVWKENKTGFTSLYDYHLRPRRQETDKIEYFYIENGALYAIRKEAFDITNDFLGNNPDIYVLDRVKNPQVDIDTPEDFEKAESLITEKLQKKLPFNLP